jgi:hypothetical protein
MTNGKYDAVDLTQPTVSNPVEAVVMLPCPFCGGEPVFPESKDTYGTCYEAGCEDCGLPALSIQIIDCFDYPRDHVHDSWSESEIQYGIEYIEVARNEAIERWNKRAS